MVYKDTETEAKYQQSKGYLKQTLEKGYKTNRISTEAEAHLNFPLSRHLVKKFTERLIEEENIQIKHEKTNFQLIQEHKEEVFQLLKSKKNREIINYLNKTFKLNINEKAFRRFMSKYHLKNYKELQEEVIEKYKDLLIDLRQNQKYSLKTILDIINQKTDVVIKEGTLYQFYIDNNVIVQKEYVTTEAINNEEVEKEVIDVFKEKPEVIEIEEEVEYLQHIKKKKEPQIKQKEVTSNILTDKNKLLQFLVIEKFNQLDTDTLKLKEIAEKLDVDVNILKGYLINYQLYSFFDELKVEVTEEKPEVIERVKTLKQIGNQLDYNFGYNSIGLEFVADYNRMLLDYFLDLVYFLEEIGIATEVNEEELSIKFLDYPIKLILNSSYTSNSSSENSYGTVPVISSYHQKIYKEEKENGFQLIQLYEWDLKHLDKIKEYLYNLCNKNKQVYYARKLKVVEVDKKTAKVFLDKYHLQGYRYAKYSYGLVTEENELVQIATFDIPRFNKNIDYEWIRLVNKNNTIVIGGTQRLFKHFIKELSPKSIISYADISKFTGDIYKEVGFVEDNLTKPNYRWVNMFTRDIKTRYQCQMRNEREIMTENGYVQVFDAGNRKFIWSVKENEI